MKNIFLLPTFIAMCISSSCKKDHVCECTYSSTDPGVTPVTTEYTFYKISEGDAKKLCVKTSRDYTSGGNDYRETTDCTLK